jgi:hypothetical protein
MENMIDELNEDTEPEEIKFISLKWIAQYLK